MLYSLLPKTQTLKSHFLLLWRLPLESRWYRNRLHSAVCFNSSAGFSSSPWGRTPGCFPFSPTCHSCPFLSKAFLSILSPLPCFLSTFVCSPDIECPFPDRVQQQIDLEKKKKRKTSKRDGKCVCLLCLCLELWILTPECEMLIYSWLTMTDTFAVLSWWENQYKMSRKCQPLYEIVSSTMLVFSQFS